jgi:uncharacterized repeat protein (TIGR01451 family)
VIHNAADYAYIDSSTGKPTTGKTNMVSTLPLRPLVDPLGQVLGCNGQLLPDYSGFSVGLFEPDPSDPTGTSISRITRLTTTEIPDDPNNTAPLGLAPNDNNVNPFPLSNADQGRYNFLLDVSQGQLDIGRTYILMVDPPADSIFEQRRVKIEILNVVPTLNRSIVTYRATSLDGLPLSTDGQPQIDETVATVGDAEQVSLQLLAVQFTSVMCNPAQVSLSKSGDRANAAPGDTVIYRLTVRNISDGALGNVALTDILPMGFKFLDGSVRGEIDGVIVPITAERQGMVVTFRTTATLPPGSTLNIAYGAQLTPDALRGDGENSATVAAQRTDNSLDVRDGPAVHRVRVNPGLVSDCGTILGRVFVDRNFDGEQQPGEPGVPNAVVYMDDGNRITTDEAGLFSVKCVLPGSRVGALDLTVLPGYRLAPNHKFIERNSPSRLIRLSPGGLGRMNFGVIPPADAESSSPDPSKSGSPRVKRSLSQEVRE